MQGCPVNYLRHKIGRALAVVLTLCVIRANTLYPKLLSPALITEGRSPTVADRCRRRPAWPVLLLDGTIVTMNATREVIENGHGSWRRPYRAVWRG